MTRRRILCRTFMLVLMAAAVFVMSVGMGGADEVNVTLEGYFGGPMQASAAVGNYTYVGHGLNLIVLDISNPARAT